MAVTPAREQRASFRQLDHRQIVETLERLRDRISGRFPSSGLGRVSAELLTLAHEASDDVEFIRRPHWPIRVGIGVAIAVMLGVLIAAIQSVPVPTRVGGLSEFVQTVESGINDVIFLGLAIFFLLGIETRIKRKRALAALHELRSLVHIVDMHQLTKDPEQLLSSRPDVNAAAERVLTPEELSRYLDYCTELLSLSSKIAALFVQHFNDPVVLAAVDEVETLSGGFSSKVWQKITLLERTVVRGVAPVV